MAQGRNSCTRPVPSSFLSLALSLRPIIPAFEYVCRCLCACVRVWINIRYTHAHTDTCKCNTHVLGRGEYRLASDKGTFPMSINISVLCIRIFMRDWCVFHISFCPFHPGFFMPGALHDGCHFWAVLFIGCVWKNGCHFSRLSILLDINHICFMSNAQTASSWHSRTQYLQTPPHTIHPL